MLQESDLYFSSDHEWVNATAEFCSIGISNHAQETLGDIVYIDLPKVGAVINKGETIGSIESVKAVSDIIAPLSGEVSQVNDLLIDKPEMINQEPYGQGWMIMLKPSNNQEISQMMDWPAYQKFIQE